MPARGQTCVNCRGDCCCLIGGTAPKGSWIAKHFKQCKIKTAIKHGVVLITRDFRKCRYQDGNGLCIIYNERPAFCKSYYCHGKFWRAQEIINGN